jgi:hypothetical protein
MAKQKSEKPKRLSGLVPPVGLLLGGLVLAGLSGWYVVTAPWGLPHEIWILELTFIAGTLACLSGALWLIGLATRRLFPL